MKKTSLSILISGAIFLAVFNLLFFVIGEPPHPASVWIAYGFIHGSLILALVIPLISSGKKHFAVLSTVSYVFTGLYFGLTFIVCLIFIFTAPESSGLIKASWVIPTVLLALFLISFIPVAFANAHTNQEVARQGREAKFVQNISSKVKFLRDCVDDVPTMKELDVLYNVIASSPIKSSPDVKDLEIRMISQLTELEEAVDKKDFESVKAICTKLSRGVQERNRILQLISHN